MHANKLLNQWSHAVSAAAEQSWLPCLRLEDLSHLLLESQKVEVKALSSCSDTHPVACVKHFSINVFGQVALSWLYSLTSAL